MAAALRRAFESRLRLWAARAAARGEARAQALDRQPCRGYKMTPSDDELYQRTRMNTLERDSQNVMFIDGYSKHGFSINGNRVFGPCAVIPQAVLQWDVGSYKDISEDSLALFYILEPNIEILVLGMGDRIQRLDPKLLMFMKSKGIAVEIQDTVSDPTQRHNDGAGDQTPVRPLTS
ncbi:NADH dehydrogenase [ubiquinone] 1 alpha subcomplex assembly factor 3-like isoform X2 [Carcharodon carcharias]|uniref:NADH dehydrogenase [ubiquinone] 1 alpha subcomplex assembly factor 3-like isoform X2 n=1 Tax=Carcharodon carcharias TaxID=13397 RepID=UPI001B7DE2F6|nr:NADH dehydrogenase [ubiquinone] 1 alpha subcomplex assembly factor 3-like isoform X2 [Carcharodon carcharias]